MKLPAQPLMGLFILCLTSCLFTSCLEDNKKPNAEPPKEEIVTTTPVPTAPTDTTEAIAEVVDTTTTNNDEVAPLTTTPTEPIVSTTAKGLGDLPERFVSDNKITTVLETLARDMEARKLAYVSSLGQDCSGIYHQIKDSIQTRIPALDDDAKYGYPSFQSDRSSRQIADWYYRNGNLHIVQDPMAARNKIRPGTVMFFGRTDEKYSNMDIDLLTNPGVFVHDGTKGKIMHIAVVTSVEKDEEGNVKAYTMMHGRNKRHVASRTSGNWDGPGSFAKQHKKFPFGNWNQQWVAMAHIETPK